MNDPIVDEVRKARETISARCGYDLDSLFREIKQQEQKSGLEFVSYPPRKPSEQHVGHSTHPTNAIESKDEN